MQPVTPALARCAGFVVALACLPVAAASPAGAAGCVFESQGEGRVTVVIDERTFRLSDGREVRLAGVEPVAGHKAGGTAALAAIVAGREVTLSGDDDTPDRYGRQPAFVFLPGSDTPVQAVLVAQGKALVSADVTDKDCIATLFAAEAEARRGRRETWADPAAIKNAAGIGRFAVVEGRVLSVRQAGGTTYLNFGRNWTQDFAVTISRRVAATLEAAGIGLKSLERRRIRVRGWVEARGGPRIEVLRAAQIELPGGN